MNRRWPWERDPEEDDRIPMKHGSNEGCLSIVVLVFLVGLLRKLFP